MSSVYRIGLDVGSTTAKMVALDEKGEIVFSGYERHNADVTAVVSRFFSEFHERFGNCRVSVTISGSVGMGLAERFSAPFIQEVVAAAEYVKRGHNDISTIIDIGGEDAKIVYMRPDGNADLRMNGNCAGGTGAFIDQMALLLNVDVNDMDALAAKAEHTHPIASRCGVFSKTDVQNLISKNVSKADISASIFRAVAIQTIVTLSHGCEIVPKILFCGGPLTFIPALRKAFIDYLQLSPDDYTVPENAHLIPAWGAALSSDISRTVSVKEILASLEEGPVVNISREKNLLKPIFGSEAEYEEWKKEKSGTGMKKAPLEGYKGNGWMGIDSGSTTTKIVVTDDHDNLLFSYYSPNGGNPINAVKKGLEELRIQCEKAGAELEIRGSRSTGYGEDLIKTAFSLDGGIIETIAHYIAARKINPDVSFILDIGGQDMKAIFIDNGVLNRMEINEACSSGCGSFLETFAQSLNYSIEDFAREACLAKDPCDLGTRCTVFMNSKVKQVLREGYELGDIAAGLSYSVVKNCLYKVLKFKRAEELGGNIVVQGGTMRNDSVVRALEQLTGTSVGRSDMPELMGAYGSALYAKSSAKENRGITVEELLGMADYTASQIKCSGCENNCYIQKYAFTNNNTYFSGNKCEKVFTNGGEKTEKGRNLSVEKYDLLFDRRNYAPEGGLTIGIPRVLNMFENYPFWHTLLNECGFNVLLSPPSTFADYEKGVHSVMSDNICFPAKLAHSHIYYLMDKRADRIFYPYVVYEKWEGKDTNNSYNCPVVSGYPEVIKNVIEPDIPLDSPVINFKDRKLTVKGCKEYLSGLGIDPKTIKKAVDAAFAAQQAFEEETLRRNREALRESREKGKLTILLAGRPYHADSLVQHKISDMISDMGVTVITEDIVREDASTDLRMSHMVTQWSYINRILRAAHWTAREGNDVHFVQMTSFGCGPDAFLIDEISTILKRHGKSHTQLKIDDVNNIGSLKLRVRSLVESIRFGHLGERKTEPFVTTKKYTKEERHRTLIAPFFTDYTSPLVPAAFKLAGYDLIQLPESDMETAEYGLKYANNEVCYPATLIVGDLIKALDSGKYDLSETAVIITQTGGQCRATNYVTLLKKAMVEAGFEQVPVLSLAMGGLANDQPGFRMNWGKMVPIALAAILFGDTLSKFYHASAVREKEKGDAMRLREHYLKEAEKKIAANDVSGLYGLITPAAKDFNDICLEKEGLPKVGVVGEIYLKFNSFAHKRVVEWLIDNDVEPVPPVLSDFFMQSFVNRRVRVETNLLTKTIPLWLNSWIYSLIWKKISKVNELGSQFKYFIPFNNIFDAAEHGKEVVTLSAQFGEGWLLPAEVAGFARSGVNNVISLQPFGCIANHIVSKGAEKKIKSVYPDMNFLSLDFDSGVSDVNVTNRLMLMTNNMR